MADLEKTVQIIFEAIDNMTDPIGEMGTALSGFGGKASEVSKQQTPWAMPSKQSPLTWNWISPLRTMQPTA